MESSRTTYLLKWQREKGTERKREKQCTPMHSVTPQILSTQLRTRTWVAGSEALDQLPLSLWICITKKAEWGAELEFEYKHHYKMQLTRLNTCPCSRISDTENCKIINEYCFKPWTLGAIVMQQWKTKIVRKPTKKLFCSFPLFEQ